MKAEDNIREGEAMAFGVGVAAVIMAIGSALVRLTYGYRGPVFFTAIALMSYVGGLFAHRWHKRRD